MGHLASNGNKSEFVDTIGRQRTLVDLDHVERLPQLSISGCTLVTEFIRCKPGSER